MIAELRERLERDRRWRLRQQIGALRTVVNVMATRNDPRERTKFFKLLAKLKRLEREIAQPMLIHHSRCGGRISGA